jgi:Protein of unknown function (DUF2797)
MNAHDPADPVLPLDLTKPVRGDCFGTLRKMQTRKESPVRYGLPVGDQVLPMNEWMGRKLVLRHTGSIFCINCGGKTKSSFSQGYCFRCSQTLAACDLCIVKPETCHFDRGTCREPEWGKANCFIPHIVYLANSSGLKVGITREHQKHTRWMDQGAAQALPIVRTKSRKEAGLVEVAIAQHIPDKTNWRTLLKSDAVPVDLAKLRAEVLERLPKHLIGDRLQDAEPSDSGLTTSQETETTFTYPVTRYLDKITSFNLDKNPVVEGTLIGIKGQYLIFDAGVINIRKYAGYEVAVQLPH